MYKCEMMEGDWVPIIQNDGRRWGPSNNSKSYYEEASHVMESNSIDFGDLQREEFVVDNENEKVKGDLPIIQKDIINKK